MNWLRRQVAKLLNLHPATEWNTSRAWINYGHGDAKEDLTVGDRVTLQKWSRYFAAGDGLYNRLLELFEQYVGMEIFPASSNPDWNKRAQEKWDAWKPFADIASRDGWDVIKSRLIRSWAENGEVFVILTLEAGRPRVNMIEAHRCCTPDSKPANVTDGVELDGNGRPVAYWFLVGEKQWRRFDASYVVHLFEPERIGQVRGIPLISCVLNQLRDLKELRENEVRASKIASLIGIVRKNKAGEVSAGSMMRSRFTATNTSPTGETVTQNRTSYYESALGKDVVVLQTDDELAQFLNNRPTDSVRALWRDLKETICSGFGTPYVLAFPEGMQGTVYRGAIQMAAASYRERCRAALPHFRRIYKWVVGNDGDLISGRPADWEKITVRFPRSPSVDIGYDTNAAISSLAAGLTTYQELYAERGENWSDMLRQKGREVAEISSIAAEFGVSPESIAAASLPSAASPQTQPDPEDATV